MESQNSAPVNKLKARENCVQSLFKDVSWLIEEMFLRLLTVQRLSMTLGQAGQRSKRLMGRGSGMKATPPSFVALTTALVVRGQRSFVKM